MSDAETTTEAGTVANSGSSPLLSGLSVRAGDCPITRSVRAAMYATDLQPTEDDVIGMVNALKEDLIDGLVAACDDAIVGLYDGLNGGNKEYARLSVAYATSVVRNLEAAVKLAR